MKKESSRAGAALMKTRSSGAGAMFMKRRAPEPGCGIFYDGSTALIICITRLPHKLSLWIQNPNFRLRLRLHHLKVFGSGSSHSKLLRLRDPAPDPQLCCVLGSFILARVAGQFIVRLKLFSKRELSIGLNFKSNVLCKSIASKNIRFDMNYSFKMLNCIGKLGL